MALTDQDLQAESLDFGALHFPPDPQKKLKTARLARVLMLWWEGATLEKIATDIGVSVPRVRVILRRVGCSARTRPSRPASAKRWRRLSADWVAEARALLDHPNIECLKPCELASVIWAAQGLNSGEIAVRTGVSASTVRGRMIAAADRISRSEYPKMSDPDDMPIIDTIETTTESSADELFLAVDDDLNGTASPAESAAGALTPASPHRSEVGTGASEVATSDAPDFAVPLVWSAYPGARCRN